MSLHGLSHDAWGRYSGGKSWDYRIVAPGLQVQPDRHRGGDRHPSARPRRSDAPRARGGRASGYRRRLADVDEIELPPQDPNRIHAWHLFPDPAAARAALDRPQRVHRRAQGRRESGARCTGGRCTSIPTTRRRSAGARRISRSRPAVWERLVSLPDLSRHDRTRRSLRGETSIERLCASHRAAARGPRVAGDRRMSLPTGEPPRSGIPRPVESRSSLGRGRSSRPPCSRGRGSLVKLTSSGPVLFRQKRVGRHGRPFTPLKLRTMRVARGAGLNVTAGTMPGSRRSDAPSAYEARRASPALERPARGTCPSSVRARRSREYVDPETLAGRSPPGPARDHRPGHACGCATKRRLLAGAEGGSRSVFYRRDAPAPQAARIRRLPPAAQAWRTDVGSSSNRLARPPDPPGAGSPRSAGNHPLTLPVQGGSSCRYSGPS